MPVSLSITSRNLPEFKSTADRHVLNWAMGEEAVYEIPEAQQEQGQKKESQGLIALLIGAHFLRIGCFIRSLKTLLKLFLSLLRSLVFSLAFTITIWGGDAPEHPNVLFIAIEDMNDWTGFWVDTPKHPHMDRLQASSGDNFTNAHCSAPRLLQIELSFWNGAPQLGLYAFYDHADLEEGTLGGQAFAPSPL